MDNKDLGIITLLKQHNPEISKLLDNDKINKPFKLEKLNLRISKLMNVLIQVYNHAFIIGKCNIKTYEIYIKNNFVIIKSDSLKTKIKKNDKNYLVVIDKKIIINYNSDNDYNICYNDIILILVKPTYKQTDHFILRYAPTTYTIYKRIIEIADDI